MFERMMWGLLFIGNLLGAYLLAFKGDNIGLELIDLFSAYLCWKEMKDV